MSGLHTEEHHPLLSDRKPQVVRREKHLTIPALIVVSFFWVSGGIYGNEELITVAAPAYALPMLLITPILYSLPVVLITTELATALPHEGGSVSWINEACGPVFGAHNMYWTWIADVIDSSLYPRFAAAYFATALELDRFGQGLIALAIVLAVTFIKLLGTSSVVKFSAFLAILSVVPSCLFLMFAAKHADGSVLSYQGEGGTNWDSLLTWCLWLYSGAGNLGSVAREVENPERAFLIASSVLLFLDVIFINFTPLWFSLSIDNDRSQYVPGHFARVAEKVAGRWLFVLLTIGAQVSQIGLHNSISIAADRYLSRFMFPPAKEHSQSRYIPKCIYRFEDYLLNRGHTGVAPLVILINATINSLLVWLPITDTLNLAMAVASCSMLLMMYSFLYLKRYRRDLKRTWELPGGMPLAVLVTIPCVILSIANIVLGLIDEENAVIGMASPKVVFLVVVVLVGILVHGAYNLFAKSQHTSDEEREAIIRTTPD